MTDSEPKGKAALGQGSQGAQTTDVAKPQTKRRKSQSEEDFESQKLQFSGGPVVQTEDWLLERQFGSETPTKIERGYMKSAAERAFYVRDYEKVQAIIAKARDQNWEAHGKEFSELEKIGEAAKARQAEAAAAAGTASSSAP